MSAPVTQALADFAAAPLPATTPEAVLHAGERAVANAVALAVGASRHPAVEIALAVAAELAESSDASLLGRDRTLPPQWAAFTNAIAVHVEDFDDTHLATIIHPSAPVVPAALAAAESEGASGRELLEAVLVGAEIALRVGLAVSPWHFDRGWHVTGTAGHFGAAAAAGRLLGLDGAQLANALGIAATEAAGLQAALGSMTKALHAGKAAADGVEAALLAARGFTGPVDGIEGRRGFAEVASSSAALSAALDALGQRWHLADNAFKPYACGIVAHPAIDAAIAVRDRFGDPGALADVLVTVNPVVLDVMGVADPAQGLESKFSVYHCVAVGLLDGAAGPAQYEDARAQNPAIRALRAKVRVVADPSMPRDAAAVVLRTADGTELAHRVEHASGSRLNPMSDGELREKARLVASGVLGDRVDALMDAALELRSLEHASALAKLARPRPAAARTAGVS